MKILIVNCGSSSLKCQLINMKDETVLAKGVVEEIGNNSKYCFEANNNKSKKEIEIKSHEEALTKITNDIIHNKVVGSLEEISAIGHRVVHGGEYFKKSAVINEEVIKAIEKCSDLAPLHNPANLIGINACEKLFNKKMVAVFDTAFHQTMPEKAYIYPLPYKYYKKYNLRKYGFHGTSHKYVANRTAEILGKKLEDLNIISCHLGNGASLAAIKKGKCINTSMGFTPLAGVMMGTRSGDIDPSIIPFLMKKEHVSIEEIETILNKKSGLLGISEISSDCREIEKEAWENNDKKAQLALDKFGYRIKEYLGSFAAIMDGLDVVVFTAGLGENSPETREFVCKNLEHFGIKIDKEKNKVRGKEQIISKNDSNVKVIVIPTNEELMIARETKNKLNILNHILN